MKTHQATMGWVRPRKIERTGPGWPTSLPNVARSLGGSAHSRTGMEFDSSSNGGAARLNNRCWDMCTAKNTPPTARSGETSATNTEGSPTHEGPPRMGEGGCLYGSFVKTRERRRQHAARHV